MPKVYLVFMNSIKISSLANKEIDQFNNITQN